MQLNDLSNEFKQSQRQFIQKLKGIKERRKSIGVGYEDKDLNPEERRKLEELQDKIFQKGFDESQMEQVLENQRDLLSRDRELGNILTSVIELKSMFEQFSTLVIEQGTLLDRIDYNLEQSEVKVDQGTQDLVQAEQTQKCSTVTICLIFVVIAVLCIAILLAIKIIWKLI